MRKYFAPTPPSEDVRSIKRVSLEAELIIIDQAKEEATAADNCLSETERLIDLAGALEDLAVIADGIEQATPTQLDLIDTVAQMAVAGTDVAPEELLRGPALAVGQSVATEAWKETAANIWKTIKAFVKKIWDHIDKFFKVHVVLPGIYARLQLALRQLKNRTGQLKYGAKPEMDITTGLQYFSNGQRLQQNTAEFAKELEKFGKAVDMVYVANPERVAKLGKNLANIIADWEPEDTDRTLDMLRAALGDSSKPTNLPYPMTFRTDEGDFTAMSSYEVLGGCYFKFLTFDDNVDTVPLLALERFRHTGLSVVNGEDLKEDEIEGFKHGTAAQYEKIIQDFSDMIQVIARFNKAGGAMAKLREAKASLEHASDLVIKEVSGGDYSKVDEAYVRSMVSFNTAFARWTQQPAVAFYTKVIGVARAILMLVAHYNAVYEVKDRSEEARIVGDLKGA